jgi:hypothetical protein
MDVPDIASREAGDGDTDDCACSIPKQVFGVAV